MKTLKQLERALANAERRVDEYYWALEAACSKYVVPTNALPAYVDVLTGLKETPRFFALGISADGKNTPLKVSSLVEYVITNGGTIYRGKEYAACETYTRATKREVSRLLQLERKLNAWNEKRYWLDNLLDYIDNDGVIYRCEGFEECVRELAALGYSVENPT